MNKIVKTAKAKSHIKKWIKKKQFDQSIKLGKEIIALLPILIKVLPFNILPSSFQEEPVSR